MSKKIFISYRRDDTNPTVNRLFDALSKSLGGQHCIFQDTEGIDSGGRFIDVIKDTIAKSHVVLVAIGPDFITDEKRIFKEGDFIRLEIQHALKCGKSIIPVLIDGASLPSKNDLPSSIHSMLEYNAATLRNDRWAVDCEDLVKDITKLLPSDPINRLLRTAFTLLGLFIGIGLTVSVYDQNYLSVIPFLVAGFGLSLLLRGMKKNICHPFLRPISMVLSALVILGAVVSSWSIIDPCGALNGYRNTAMVKMFFLPVKTCLTEKCWDYRDNDGDGRVDCEDCDCYDHQRCSQNLSICFDEYGGKLFIKISNGAPPYTLNLISGLYVDTVGTAHQTEWEIDLTNNRRDNPGKYRIQVVDQSGNMKESTIIDISSFKTIIPQGLSREWLAEDLNIPGKDDSSCMAQRSGDTDITNFCKSCSKGRLYGRSEAIYACKRIGKGWRLPTFTDWKSLTDLYGGAFDKSVPNGSKTKGKSAFDSLTIGGSSRFDAQRCGYIDSDGILKDFGRHVIYWTDSLSRNGNAWTYLLNGDKKVITKAYYHEDLRLSCRCVRDLQ